MSSGYVSYGAIAAREPSNLIQIIYMATGTRFLVRPLEPGLFEMYGPRDVDVMRLNDVIEAYKHLF